MCGWFGGWKPAGKLPCSQTDCLPQNIKVASESVHCAEQAIQCLNCEKCDEENMACKCKVVDKTGDPPDQDVEQPAKANCSFFHAVINMSGMLIGLGQLSTPYALQCGGWSSSSLLIALGIASAYSAHLLGKCLDKDTNTRSYADVGQRAFGMKGKMIASVFIYMEIFMSLVSYTISLHDNLNIVFPGTTFNIPQIHVSQPNLLTIVAVLVALPSLWLRDLSSISFLSSGGILMSLLIFATVSSTSIFGDIKPNERIPVLQLHKIPQISGLFIFSYAGHIVFPNIHQTMKEPSKFPKVVCMSFTLVTSLYMALGFMGAKLFGPSVNPQITLSMPPHLVVSKIALWATVLTPMTKYALQLSPFAIKLEQKLPDSMSQRTKMIVRGSAGSTLLMVILCLALYVPYFQYVLSLTGSVVSIGICIILPCTFYTKIFFSQVTKRRLTLNLVLIILSITLGVFGTITSSKLLTEAVRVAHRDQISTSYSREFSSLSPDDASR